MATSRPTYREVIRRAALEVQRVGGVSPERLEQMLAEIAAAARADRIRADIVERDMQAHLQGVFRRLVDRGEIKRKMVGMPGKFGIEIVRPSLRAELDRRIIMSAMQIRLDRDQAIERTLRRFAGWSTSIPPGGSALEIPRDLDKPLASLPFQERRVIIDQGHKLRSAIASIVAAGSGAIAARWHSHWKQANYNYRKPHKYRDGKIYLLRDSWARQAGLVKPDPDAGYTDEITQPGEEVYCRCIYVYLFNLRDLPEKMLTEKGKRELNIVRERARQLLNG